MRALPKRESRRWFSGFETSITSCSSHGIRHRRIPHCERHFALRISFIGCKPSRVHVTDLLYAGVSGEMGSGRTGDPLPTELLTSLKKQQRLRCAKTISHLREDIVE